MARIADWDINLTRVFVVDNDAGNDLNLGYQDVPDGHLQVDASVALKTWSRLVELLPLQGDGRKCEVLLKTRAGGATYLASDFTTPDDLNIVTSNYKHMLVRATSTDATAGSNAFGWDVYDKVHCGAIRATGTNTNGYNVSHSSVDVSGATTASPIAVTAVAHGFATGDKILIQRVNGLHQTNGVHTITVTGVDTFTLDGSQGALGGTFSTDNGLGTAQRWKVTLAGGGAPGFTDDLTGWDNVGRRIRFNVATTTAALRNHCAMIWALGIDCLIPQDSFPATPVASDVFYIEQPGVVFANASITAFEGVLGAQSVLGNTAAVPFQICGIATTGHASVSAASRVSMSFVGFGGLFTAQYCNSFECESTYRDVVGATILTGVGMRSSGATIGILNCLSVLVGSIAHVGAGSLFMEFCPLYSIASGSFLRSGMSTRSSGSGGVPMGVRTAPGSIGAISLTRRGLRAVQPAVGGGITGSGIIGIMNSICVVNGVDLTGAGSQGAIQVTGSGSRIQIRAAVGTKGNTAIGITLGQASSLSSGSLSFNVDNTIVFFRTLQSNFNSLGLSGELGDIEMPSRFGTNPILTYEDFPKYIDGIVDAGMNHLSTSYQGAGVNLNRGHLNDCRDVSNSSGALIPKFSVLRASGSASFHMACSMAKADAAATSNSIVGVSVNDSDGTSALKRGILAVTAGEAVCRFDTAIVQADTGKIVYLSEINAGRATIVVPPQAASNQKVRIGIVARPFESIGTDLAIVNLQLPDGPPVLSNGVEPDFSVVISADFRRLIHYLSDEGASLEDTAGVAFKEILPAASPFWTSVIWYQDAGKTKKVIELQLVRDALQRPTTETWTLYAIDGTTVQNTATDVVTYSGVTPFELSRLRTLT